MKKSFQAGHLNNTFAFHVPVNASIHDRNNTEKLIWAFSKTRPDPSPNSTLIQHFAAGFLDLKFNKELPDHDSLAAVPGIPSGQTPAKPGIVDETSEDIPSLGKHERLVLGHGILVSIGFLLLLPLGSLVGRWGRTFTPRWFTIHRIVNFAIALPIIAVGWALGPIAVASEQATHFLDAHQVKCPTFYEGSSG